MKNIKVALVHDWLTGQRGGEKVLEVFSEIFPRAPIYTLLHVPGSQHPALEEKKIVTSFLQRIPGVHRRYRFFLPLFPLAVELLDLQAYDMIISSSHCVAKGIVPRPDALHISYIHSPMRYAWNLYGSYFGSERLGVFSRFLIPPVIHRLRLWDTASSARVDRFLANSRTVADRIEKYYRREARVMHPPVDTEFFRPAEEGKEGYLIVSALVPYKRIDLAVDVFNRNGFPLRIVGTGPETARLRRKARSNIRFLGPLSASDLLREYQCAKALIMPGEEDFGINSLEAQACGTPVIAYGRGGATETVVNGVTGLFFSAPNGPALREALDKFQSMTFNKIRIRENAERFSRNDFKEEASSCFQEMWSEYTRRHDR